MLAQSCVEDIQVGLQVEPIEYGPITTRLLVQWCAAADDYHEIHYDLPYTQKQGLPDVVVPGPQKLALMGRMLMQLAGPRGLIRRMNCRYLGLDVQGMTLRLGAHVTGVNRETGDVELELTVTNSDEKVTSSGHATVWLPSRSTEA